MLTPAQATDTAAAIVARARAAGADAADAVFAADAATAVQVRMGALEDVGRAESAELGLRVFVGHRSASVSTSDLSDDALATLVDRAVAMARLAPEDPWAGLAPADRLLTGIKPDLDLDDHGDPAPDALKARALAVEEAARSVPGVTMSDGASASASRVTIALATSHGFSGGYSLSSYNASASVLAGETGAMERDYATHTVRHLSMLDAPEAIGRLAGERVAARVNPGRIQGGAMPVVFDRRIAGGLIGALLSAISGAAIARQTSFLLHALGTPVLPKGVHILDDPHRPRGLRSKPFDGEGLPVSPTRIVDDGVLQTWLMDSAAARQLGLEPTGHASRGVSGSPGATATNVHLTAGATPRATLIGEIDRGVLVTEVIGHGVNGVTGDYSLGAAGFLIERGEITRPVSEFTIAGNLKAMFLALTPASDLEFRGSMNAPSLRIDGMMVAGG
ncbi:metallopeptidase TldD-related protein [Sphingomonas donggukensis]|uniref:Metallopeptidase TldD-related protein n=1 Tax=Sphingomonas donggukensis TaxID=2949093 RepID=A0ABY4TQT9_9SPHN|nr:metallopeptidase TldD-related protein [Sphingomonas donggukensis]URW74602.1 metallopeptidase TldD-related protein [Sphingomonas donggukensis]